MNIVETKLNSDHALSVIHLNFNVRPFSEKWTTDEQTDK